MLFSVANGTGLAVAPNQSVHRSRDSVVDKWRRHPARPGVSETGTRVWARPAYVISLAKGDNRRQTLSTAIAGAGLGSWSEAHAGQGPCEATSVVSQ